MLRQSSNWMGAGQDLGITALKLGNDGSKFYGDFLFDRLKERINGLRLVESIDGREDVLLIGLDNGLGVQALENRRLPPSAFKVFIVHELTRNLISYLKRADLVIYGSILQKRLVEDVIGLKYDSLVLPFPSLGSGNTGGEGAFVYIGESYTEESKDYVTKVIESCLRHFGAGNIWNVKICMDVPEEKAEDYGNLIRKSEEGSLFEIATLNRRNMDLEEIFQAARGCVQGEYFKRERSVPEFERMMKDGNSEPQYIRLAADPLASSFGKLDWIRKQKYDGLSKYYMERPEEVPDLDSYCESLASAIRAKLPLFQSSQNTAPRPPAIDGLNDLAIIHGAPLSNKYVFSVCFRNQSAKILRCIKSLLMQNNGHDFGIVFVDDDSDDDSSDIILRECLGKQTDFVLVKNKERKYAAKNLYNVIHQLVTNGESILIEVDGDDFLPGSYVLDVLNGYYGKGCLKTLGSYEMFPKDQVFANEERLRSVHENVDFRRPWSIAACNAWLHLRSTKVSILRRVEIENFLDRRTGSWLSERHDAAIHPRAIELAEGKIVFVKEVLYVYDVSGENHDHGSAQNRDEMRILTSLDRLHGPFSLE